MLVDYYKSISEAYKMNAIGRKEGIQEMKGNIKDILEQNISCSKKIDLLQKLVNNV